MMAMSRYLPSYLLRPIRLLGSYDRSSLQPDLVAGITVAVVGLPQAIAFALIAELPPQMGIYAAIVAAIIGALWGSSGQVHTGPANAVSLLVASSLLVTATPDTGRYLVAAGLLAIMAGLFQVTLGLARLGMLVNFVSHSVIVGFATGAGIQIAIKQLRPLFGVAGEGGNLLNTLYRTVLQIPDSHLPTTLIGIGTILAIVLLRHVAPKVPGSLVAMVIASVVVFVFGLHRAGVAVIGELPAGLPPLADLPLFDLDLIADLSTGALAVGAIGLVQTAAIGRSMATQGNEQLDSNQEFVGQGLANIVTGFFSGYPVAASFSRSAVNAEAGARTPMAALFSGIFVLVGLFVVGPLAAYLPMSALAGVLIVTAYSLVDVEEIARIWRGARADAAIMLVTLFGTLFLRLDFAVLAGILMSFALYILNTSSPRVRSVMPDDNFRHFVPRPDRSDCPQLAIFEIQGDLYFGAVNHVEKTIRQHMNEHPTQRFLLLRMKHVNHCDFSGIHMLELIVSAYRDRGGGVYFTGVSKLLLTLMHKTCFYDNLGADHFLDEDEAIEVLFRKVLDPAICIYESNVRVFRECQTLVRPDYAVDIPVHEVHDDGVSEMAPRSVWQDIRSGRPPVIIDVREPREYRSGHVPNSQLIPLPDILKDPTVLPNDCKIVFVCRGGRRSRRAAQFAREHGCTDVCVLKDGMLGWEAETLLKAVDAPGSSDSQPLEEGI